MKNFSEPLDRCLPTEAINKGYGLTWWAPDYYRADPVILTKRGEEVYRWEHIPTMGEVWDKIQELDCGRFDRFKQCTR